MKQKIITVSDRKRTRKPGQSTRKIKSQKNFWDKQEAAKMGAAYDKPCHDIFFDVNGCYAIAKHPSRIEFEKQTNNPHVSDIHLAQAMRPLADAIINLNWGIFDKMARFLQFLSEVPKPAHPDIFYAMSYYADQESKIRYGERVNPITREEIIQHLSGKGIHIDEGNFSRLWNLISEPLAKVTPGPKPERRHRQ
jgi:hypothetical protein